MHTPHRDHAARWRKLGVRGASIRPVSPASDFFARDPEFGAIAAYITPRVPWRARSTTAPDVS
jgi:hypothetical protein